MKYIGGYYSLKTKLVKTGLHRHTAVLDDPVSDEMMDSVNIVQRTRWRVNPFILGVMSEAFYNGDRIAGLPPADDEPMPPAFSESQWASMSDEQKGEHKLRLAKLHGANARRRGKREALARKIAMATELRDAPAIWFPHALDFRGRVYPIPQDLNPQGDDTAKALLMFADAKPCTPEGLEWLEIAVANAAGQDKLSFADRRKWIKDNSPYIIDSVKDPLGQLWWARTKANGEPELDAPWLFLALAQEMVAVWEYGPNFPTCVPVNIDATCSGIQHLSALGLDPVGARATNLVDTGERQDVYNEVATAVKRIVADDAAAGITEAQAWVGNVARGTVKRAVMTTPYGVTEQGIRDQLVADRHTEGLDGSQRMNADYMKSCIVSALSSTVVAAKQIMAYLQDVAHALAEKNIPLRWTTPLGMTIQQSYYRMAHTRVVTLFGETSLWDEKQDHGLDVRDQALAAAPNVVHSLDACHLAMSVRRAYHTYGLEHFSLIHDSYGVHACDVSTLGRVLRETFVELYSGDYLADFERQVREYAPDVELPPRPARGDFDVTRVLDSPYFFS